MKLSIILTVYNKETYLNRAFAAVLEQNDTKKDDYEVLVVNDGSTDGSLAICEKYASKDERVRIISQMNQGLSMARNNGADEAHGEYVWFVDADDIISQKAVKLICEAAETHADVLPIYAQTEGDTHVRNKIDSKAATGNDVLLDSKWEHCGVFYVLRRAFLIENELHFMSGVYHEDAEFTPRMLYMAKSIKVIPEILYTVIHEPNSITSISRPKRAFDCLIVAESLARFIEMNGEHNTAIGCVIADNAAIVINNGFHVIVQNNSEEQKKLDMAFHDKRRVLINVLTSASKFKYRLESVFFRLFPKHYVYIYKMLKYIG